MGLLGASIYSASQWEYLTWLHQPGKDVRKYALICIHITWSFEAIVLVAASRSCVTYVWYFPSKCTSSSFLVMFYPSVTFSNYLTICCWKNVHALYVCSLKPGSTLRAALAEILLKFSGITNTKPYTYSLWCEAQTISTLVGLGPAVVPRTGGWVFVAV